MAPEIQFLSSKPMLGYGTTQMRCVQPAEYLRARGWHCDTKALRDALPRATRLLILHRVADDSMTRRAVAIARARGAAVVYDVDDLIFDPDGDDHLTSMMPSPLRTAPASAPFRAAIALCDAVSVSTDYLRQRVETFHPACTVMPNGLSRQLLTLADRHRRSGRTDQVTLAYFSGSSHHDDDFAVIQPALKRLLAAEPSTRLLLVGKLAFDPGFHEFGERFEYRPFVPYGTFMRCLGDADINLVPLETASPFAQARSELKYIEAGAFAVPTIASPTDTYAMAIRHGETGLLCARDDWLGTLTALVRDPGRRAVLGVAARADVLRRHGPDAMAERWQSFVQSVLAMPRQTAGTAAPRALAAGPLMLRQGIDLARHRARRHLKRLRRPA